MLGNGKDAMMIVFQETVVMQDVVMIVVMTRMITIITSVPLSSWSLSSLITQHW